MMDRDPLWEKLKRFELERLGGSLSFADRLGAENGWNRSFTRRVIDEYRRFLYLAARAGHKVTPSRVIDEAWHLHLLYTESYWGDLCVNVLEQPLHHGPTTGGVAEEEKFRRWYQRTLESYARIFGEDPPDDIWPSTRSMNTGKLKRYRLIDRERYFVFRRPSIRHLPHAVAIAAIGAVFAGAARRDATLIEAEDLVLVLIIALVVGFIVLVTRKRKGGHDSSGSCSGGCGSGTSCSSEHDGAGSDSGGGDSGGDGGGCGGGCGGGGD